jgi:Tol biopolymer transport system component
MENYGLAMKYARDAVALDDNELDKEVYELLGKSYHRMGGISTTNLDSAIYFYQKAIEVLPAFRSKELSLNLRIEQCKFAKEAFEKGERITRIAVQSLNTGNHEYAPVLGPDGKSIYFTSRRSDTKGGTMNPDDQEFFEDIYKSVYNATNQSWDSVSNDLGRMNTSGFDALNYISRDGKTMLLTVNTTAVKEKLKTRSSDICIMTQSTSGKWSNPKLIDNHSINTSFFEGSATMTADGNTMYFVSDRKAEKSSTDIYVVQKVNKKWGEAKPLPAQINTIGRETTPFISPDGRFLFFSSDGLLGMGGLDVYVVENKGGSWGTPVNLGNGINTVNNDTHFQYYEELKKAMMSGNESLGNKSSMDLFEINMSNFTYPTSPN